MTPVAAIFCHVPFEGPGQIASLLNAKGYSLQTVNVWEATHFPDPEDVSFAVLMGGPMSVNDTQEYPWLIRETEWIRQVLQRVTPVLGVCLGAQLMAVALGAEVYRNPAPEIGWWPIEAVHPSGASLTVLHWHGETFTLPDGAVWLEKSEACAHQSFRWGTNALALQYHVEATEASLDRLIENCRDELASAGPYVQTEARIREGWDRFSEAASARLEAFLDELCPE